MSGARAKALMVLGTGSGVGKSVIAAGLCRIFSDWGYRVAPFKAQNMSNNSFVTEAGEEMGRAQVVQAECARVRPQADMNPVLLKPAADNCSQAVVQGHAIGHFSAADFYSRRDLFAGAIRESYDRLAREYEIIVLEGAGSPAEVNLKEKDLVNMKMAELADAACLLVGDIDRGGIFASLLGTLDLLSAGERDRIAGLIVNKFRGDRSLFEDGVAFLEARSGKKVFGVIPYERGIRLDEEDSVPDDGREPERAGEEALDVAVLLFPRMSNFTDFEVLKHEPGVRLRYVRDAEDLGTPDLLILPGTKATMEDLRYLREHGYCGRIRRYARDGGRILGICGGYQMMGEKLLDPEHVESGSNETEGLGFFNITTRFSGEKILRRVSTRLDVPLFGGRVSGGIEAYEIHMGETVRCGAASAVDPSFEVHPSGRYLGTYYHGLFDASGFRKSFLDALAASAGKKRRGPEDCLSAGEWKEIHYGRWAGHLTQHLNMDGVRECLDLFSRLS